MRIGFGAIGIKKGLPGSLDYIDVDSFRNEDICLVVENNKMWFYTMDAYSGEDENYPFIIKPKNINGDSFIAKLKRWKLISQKNFTTNIIQSIENDISTRKIRYIDDLTIESSSGNEIIIDDDSVTFPLTVSGVSPEDDNQVTTKQYFDIELTLMDNEIQDFLDVDIDYFNANTRQGIIEYIDSKVQEFDNAITLKIDTDLSNYDYESDIQNYLDALSLNGEGYIDSEVNTWNSTIRDNVISYIDYNVEWLEDYNWSIYKTNQFIIDSWDSINEVYYTEIVHGINTNKYLAEFYIDNEICWPEKVEKSDGILMIWNSTNDIMKIILNYMDEYSS